MVYVTEVLLTTIYRKLLQIPSAEADTEPASSITLFARSQETLTDKEQFAHWKLWNI